VSADWTLGMFEVSKQLGGELSKILGSLVEPSLTLYQKGHLMH